MNATSDDEISAELVHVVHVDESSGEPQRTYLALADRDGLSVSIDGDNESFRPAAETRERRYKTSETVDIEVTSPRDRDDELLETLGLVDDDGKLQLRGGETVVDSDDDEYIELIYFDRNNPNGIDDAQTIDRYADVKLGNDIEWEVSETPPLLSWTWWVEGDIWLGYEDEE